MSLFWAWFWSILSVIAGLAVLGGVNVLLDWDWSTFWEVIILFGGMLTALAIPFLGIGLSVDAYQSHERAGQVCVHSESYTRDVLVGKVIVPVTGSECTVWAPMPTHT